MKMKQMKTIITLLILPLIISNIFMLTSYAQSPEETKLYSDISYDLNSKQEKEFTLLAKPSMSRLLHLTPPE